MHKIILGLTDLVHGFILIAIDSSLKTEMCRFTSCHLARGLCCRHAPLRPLLGLAFLLSHLLGSCLNSFINSLENKNHGIWSHHFMAGRQGNNGNSETLYFFRLQKSL